MKRSLTLLAVLGVSFLVSACNTMSGVGEDTAAAGKAIDRSAERNKGY